MAKKKNGFPCYFSLKILTFVPLFLGTRLFVAQLSTRTGTSKEIIRANLYIIGAALWRRLHHKCIEVVPGLSGYMKGPALSLYPY